MESEDETYDHYKKGIDNAPVVHGHKVRLVMTEKTNCLMRFVHSDLGLLHLLTASKHVCQLFISRGIGRFRILSFHVIKRHETYPGLSRQA